MSLQGGTTIAGRYRLMRLIATGGMGQVWETMDTRLDRRVAVKVLKAEFSDDPEFLERFRTEARTTAQLNHPGIANVFDYGEAQDPGAGSVAYLVMELVNGEPLNAVLSRVGRLSLNNSLDMLEQTGRALKAAHDAGLVHRDVKPGNILITPTGRVKITDFGIAKAVDAAPVTQTGMVMGTAQYISPEQALGEDATAASDVYSLGIVGYEAIAGRRPFLGDGAITVAMKHIREEAPPLPTNLPVNVRELIEITIAKDPKQRYADGGEFADAVAAVRAGRRAPLPGTAAAAGARPATAMMAPMTGATRPTPPPQHRAAVAPVPVDRQDGWSTGQKALAAAAVILLLGALVLVGFLILNSDDATGDVPTRSTTPTTTTTTRTTTPPPTTTEETTTEETTTTTTRTTTTTTEETTTTTESTTGGFTLPSIQIPGLPARESDDQLGQGDEEASTSAQPEPQDGG
ncbi:protein kinase domain-containing protein [Williamsia muralis]|uniref:non-specific serine/threonine protein kinase n=1 Tax=Williamsia marianensis TaxID=85044 RepID=A0A2G3PP16_WILMA|nr:protein kinase [Williamsia marianensis]PHV66812.1 serine/threonine protein kinase [Williamsia marianensis]